MLIIGCGNRQRGDDAAGLIVAERLRNAGIHTKSCSGEATELMELWHDHDHVIVIDAVMTGASIGMLHVWDAGTLPKHVKVSASTHGFGLAEAVELSRTLGRMPARLRVYGIEGREFGIAAEISPEVIRAIEMTVRRIEDEIRG